MERVPPRPTSTHGRSEIWTRKPFVRAIKKTTKRVAERLRALRKAQGKTQAEAAEMSGLHPVSVARIEAGDANITLATLVALAMAYGVELSSLFTDDVALSEPKARSRGPSSSGT